MSWIVLCTFQPKDFHNLTKLFLLLRPGKVYSLFPISHFLDFDAGGLSLFIIDYTKAIQLGAIHTHFPGKKLGKTMS